MCNDDVSFQVILALKVGHVWISDLECFQLSFFRTLEVTNTPTSFTLTIKYASITFLIGSKTCVQMLVIALVFS